MARQGRIIVNGDEHTLSDQGYEFAPDAERFAQNVASWLTGGEPGAIHAYSTSPGVTGSRLAEAPDIGRAYVHGWHPYPVQSR